MSNTTKVIRTRKFYVKRNTPLGQYFHEQAIGTNNLYNQTNYWIRQTMTGLKKDNTTITKNEQDILNYLITAFPKWKKDQINKTKTNIKETENDAELTEEDQNKKLEKLNKRLERLESMEGFVSAEKWFLGYETLEYLLKTRGTEAYTALPGQVNQQAIKQVTRAWETYFKALKDYKKNPDKYLGTPNIPGYRTKGSENIIRYTKQVSKIKTIKEKDDNTTQQRTCIRFPKTNLTLNTGTFLPADAKLCQVEVKPAANGYYVLVSVEVEPITQREDNGKYAGLDLGCDNLATVVTNTGARPLLVSGGVAASINQYWNKTIARLKSQCERYQKQKTSRRIQYAWWKRGVQLGDVIGWAANQVVKYLVDNDISALVVGYNAGWKQGASHKTLGDANAQEFVQLPFDRFVSALEWKCEDAGICCERQEESYTSKASLLDLDPIPVWDGEHNKEVRFSGYRRWRGWFVSGKRDANGKRVGLNADVNGAGNILRKCYPGAFDGESVLGVLGSPIVVCSSLVFGGSGGVLGSVKGKPDGHPRVSCRG